MIYTTDEAYELGVINEGTYKWAHENELIGFVRYTWTRPVRWHK
jgi:hypothetical protein